MKGILRMNDSISQTSSLRSGFNWRALLLGLFPLLALGAVIAYIVFTGGGLRELSSPPLEQLNVERITLPEPGKIVLHVVNDGPEPLTIAQIAVDEAYWDFQADPSSMLPRLGRATITIPYPWVNQEAHVLKFVTSIGTTFEAEIPIAVVTPKPSGELFLNFALVGFYIGIVPIALGMLWFPILRRLNPRGMNFILSLTVGLLVFLAVGTWLDALEFADQLAAFWQGVPLVVFVSLIALGALVAIGAVYRGSRRVLDTAYLLSLGIGLHNLGEGLAIGAAFALGQAALGTFLIVGFALHNITEGVGIVTPLVRKPPRFTHFLGLILLGGGPAILGTWVGGFGFNPVLATIFLAVGVGAILQVIWEVGKLVVKESNKLGDPPLNWTTLFGLSSGLVIMYFTAFLVKF